MPADVSELQLVRPWEWELCDLSPPEVDVFDVEYGAQGMQSTSRPPHSSHGNIWHVVRDDKLEGGTKVRYLRALVNSLAQHPETDEVVFAGPAQGALPLALAVCFRERATLWYPQRKLLTARQKETLEYGAQHIYSEYPNVRPSIVKKRARDYSDARGALCIRWSLSYPEVVKAIAHVARLVDHEYGPFDELWVAGGGGTLTRGLCLGVPHAEVHCVGVGRRMLPHEVDRAIVHVEPYMSMDRAVSDAWYPPFSCDRFYDAKAWQVANQGCTCHSGRRATLTGRKLFWNVVRDVRDDLL